MKKSILAVLTLILALPLNSMAYYTVIKNATTQEIRDAIVQMAAQSGSLLLLIPQTTMASRL